MFTGLIAEIGVVNGLTRGSVWRLAVASEKVIGDAAVGDSVAVDGVCLTVTAVSGRELSFDVVPETLARSTLKDLRVGDKVNLEASLRAGKQIGGHFVLGHVDAVGTVESVKPLGESSVLRIGAPAEVLRFVVEKGSIALDGISLTVASRDHSGFVIAVIPQTLSSTTLGHKRPGDHVNLEADILGKYVERFLSARGASSGLSEEMLRESGFI